MSLITRLLDEHAQFRLMGQTLEAQVRSPQPDPRHVLALATEFKRTLDAHADLEDRVFYPAVRRVMGGSGVINDAFMNHLDNEHRKVDEYLLRMLDQVKGGDLELGWAQSFALFSIGLRTHIRKEEEALFPEAERLLGPARLAELG